MPNLSKVNNVTGDTSTISKINGVAVTGFDTVDGQTFVTGPAGLEAIDPDESLFSYSNTISQQDSVDSRDITLSIWLKDDGSSSGEDTIFNMHTSGSGGLAMNYQNGAGIRIMSWTSSTWEFDYTIDADIDNGSWHHFVYSRDGSASTHYLFVDGTDQTSNIVITGGDRSSFAGNVWQGTTYYNVHLLTETSGGGNKVGAWVTQLFIDYNYYNLSTGSVLDKFYDDGAVNMGTDGTSSGLTQPRMFHTGDTGDFFTLGGNTSAWNYGISTTGSGADISADNGPAFG